MVSEEMKKAIALFVGLVVVVGIMLYELLNHKEPLSGRADEPNQTAGTSQTLRRKPIVPRDAQSANDMETSDVPSPAQRALEKLPKAKLSIQIDGLRNDKGNCQVSIFRSAYGFPVLSARAFRVVTADINNRRSTVTVDLPQGHYAVGVFHDENNNHILDTNNEEMPVEGVGASRNASRRFGPPVYEDARFHLEPPGTAITILVRY